MSTPRCRTLQHIVLALLCLAVPLFAQSGPTTIRHDVHHDVSLPLSEMIKHAPPVSLARRRVESMKLIPLPPALAPAQQDPVIQVGTVTPLTPPVTLGFEGLGAGQYGFSVTGAPRTPKARLVPRSTCSGSTLRSRSLTSRLGH